MWFILFVITVMRGFNWYCTYTFHCISLLVQNSFKIIYIIYIYKLVVIFGERASCFKNKTNKLNLEFTEGFEGFHIYIISISLCIVIYIIQAT